MRTAAAIAERSGPSVTLAFIVAGVGCAFAGLCYAEFASMIPIAGSAYTYSYATMGELVAWIIGWDLILEYAVGAATVAIAWSEYFNRVLEFVGHARPVPMVATRRSRRSAAPASHGIMNIPAVVILLLLSALLIRGTQESAFVNSIIVITKVAIVLMVIVIGWGFINPANHTPFIPAADDLHDAAGRHASTTAASWGFSAPPASCSSPSSDSTRSRPRRRKRRTRSATCRSASSARWSSARSSTCCSRYVLSGVATVEDFRTAGREASVAFAISKYMTGYEWLSKFVTVAILAGFSSVILVMLLGQSRVFYLDEPRRPGAEGLLRRASEVQDAVQVEHAVLRA